jgi:hypothetical protein
MASLDPRPHEESVGQQGIRRPQSKGVAMRKTDSTSHAIDKTIRGNLNRFRKASVLTERPGYEIAKHQLTGKHVIIATVHTKKADLAKNEMLPEDIDGIPVDVREATAHQRLRSHDPAAAELTQIYGRSEDQ